ncbi:hypothetical protein NIES4072_12570 [Nostoc commune NIES-4072]|uniref:TonB C-terminal domain-containing protein n=1 Tax=Nostoc commune NIES-4072 TaxID=2005467 RepID=A0A2R5FG91_NOSCO|nr:hypothetical protein [Nostoc commune]BBD65079.1 hypothetical protein NIES4070_14250 [Nostoc commune HK-02]GBG17596.1 hypothetical protein NIES4072_12570 [Nostoc commune NIES-4072]
MPLSVADKTPIPSKVWRRHTDPPALWISVIIGSVSLHLLAFWLMRSSQFSRLWHQPNQATIPIEIVEISSEPKPRTRKVASEPKPVSPKESSRIQKLQPVKLPKQVVPKDKLTAKPTPNGQDRSAIALTNHKNAIAQQRQQELAQQRQRQQELAQQRQRQQELAQQRQQELAQQRQQELAQQRQQELAQQRQQELAQQRQQELAQQNGSPLQEPRTQTGQAPRTENDGTIAKTHTAGGVIVSWIPLTPSQQTILMRTDLPKDIKLPELAQSTKQDSTIAIQPDLGLKTGNFLFSLIIEANGVCSKAVLLPDQNISPGERGIYEQFAFEEVCQKNKFNPAYELADQTKKQASNLLVRFKIQPANSN